ncbi:LLM class flavin-dependent oxidoreductase [Bacillus cereus]|uniref:LLM class flavin-dependent oxidoreductase n=1 Tax=Bacillus cereus TaxID=1396 RepID=UPI00065C02CB|nr:LLM class flavin-dependent oxidoreductase [Bacillus cereus]KMQ32190.1 hypothetical protein TU58_01510 [Bacillus cereus]
MEFCWNLPAFSSNSFNGIYEDTMNQAKRAEQMKFDQLLVPSVQKAADPWIVATQIASVTQQIRILVAQNTNHMLPTVSAKALTTLNNICNNRIDLNIVTGSSLIELSRDGNPMPHDVRYKRTNEYVEIIRKLREGPLSFDGEFYQLVNADLFPKENMESFAQLFVAGSSKEAMQVAAKSGDVHIIYANSLEAVKEQSSFTKQLAKEYGRKVRFGMFIDIISRSTKDEAWNAAYDMVGKVPKIQRRKITMFLNNIDSVGHSNNRSFKKYDNFMVNQHVWGGLSQVSNAVSLSIVGSYEDVRSTIKKYHACGVDYFLFSGSVGNNEIERIGEYILPYLR